MSEIHSGAVTLPLPALFELPEKVLQFGTGVLLRALPDYFIDAANRRGIFNGRVVVIKSTEKGESATFGKQDCLYTVCTRGIFNEQEVEQNEVHASISRVLIATDQWEEVIKVAQDPGIRVIVSNTTEVGIQLVEESIHSRPPHSFPAKLLAVLYARYQSLQNAGNGGFVIIATELIPDNAAQLKKIILQLARFNNLDNHFITWIETANTFCNSLVDRIVPGKPEPMVKEKLEKDFGYTDDLMVIAEVYKLWAIEGNEAVKQILSFAAVEEGVVIAPDISLYRELKLRMLNGTHTLSSGIAFLAGCETVVAAMQDPILAEFISRLMHLEIAPAIPLEIDNNTKTQYGNQVLERFRNPYLQHKWINITLQYSTKMKMRNLPLLLEHYRHQQDPPPMMALGFAAWIFFMKPVVCENGKYYGLLKDKKYLIQDDRAELFYSWWKSLRPEEVVPTALHDRNWWGADLSALPGFAKAVTTALHRISTYGMRSAVKLTLEKKKLEYES